MKEVIGFIIVALVFILFFVFICWLCFDIGNMVETQGLKSILESVWYGSGK